ncbi:hypothetical protein DPEC_G00072360 [Dallia pectoralis]|uniref:Uncharacterized protein n=1 Tax=Dallia pectoralis TaxID=75939 RepID=A0ACC2H339_DALPE|nr:hypothetical protein DPEC_G00072360 [Dallia pectoralis]
MFDAETVYTAMKSSRNSSEVIVYQNVHRVGNSESLFYTPVVVGGAVTLGGMLDSGSMACSISEMAEIRLREAGVVTDQRLIDVDVVLIGCGGLRVKPKCAFEVEMELYGCKMLVPILVVQGQHDELILGTNVIKYILHQSKLCDSYWKTVSGPCPTKDSDIERFMSMLSGLSPWKGGDVPDKVGTVRCSSATYLEPGREYLIWGKLPKNTAVSPGSTVMTEPTSSRSAPRDVLVARIVTPLWGDRWVPLKLINASDRPVLLRRNAKLADVFSCVALEDMDAAEPLEVPLNSHNQSAVPPTAAANSVGDQLRSVGLSNVDIESCEVSEDHRRRMADLVLRYEDVFSRDHLDCGEAKGFVHRIHLSDSRPFRLPYRRVPPGQYQKLRQVLSEMEEKEIIRKSTSEYASPLVLVWKKNGDLRICTDFRWLNKRTLKDAHPLPHQADCLAALGGNCLFSTMDLTSGFYNMPLHEDDKKYSAFTTPMGLYEYNRLPQGLCNSPGSFMRMMTSIFGDQNYLSLLCYLDDLLVFAPDEETAFLRLTMVFDRLRSHNLKLSPKKCFFLRRSVKFLGHIIDENGVSTDPSKVENICNMSSADLMEHDGVTPSQKRIRSFLGMVNYYQHFVPRFSAIAKPLFDLLKGAKRKGKYKTNKLPSRKLCASDWTPWQSQAFEDLKASLVHSVVLAHPDFTRPFMLSTDASLEGLGAVLSQVQEGETRARPIAFASKSLSTSQKNYPAHRLEFLALKWSVCDKFSHWLKGHTFTIWTDNNPLTHILTKPKLDCCEQRWVAKLASYDFDIKYIPGQQNIVADALSRVPFVKESVGHRLLAEPYAGLLSAVRGMSGTSVQNAFRSSSGHKKPSSVSSIAPSTCSPLQMHVQSVEREDVSAVLQSHVEWDAGPRLRAVDVLQFLPQLVPPGQDALPAYTEKDLRDKQLEDKTLTRVLSYIERHRRPSRRERFKESAAVKRYLKHWDRLTVNNGVLYRISRHQKTKAKRFQYVVPDSLKPEVLQGIHDKAGHQAQSRSLSLARQRFFWPSLDGDVRDYVRHCQRCIVSKTVEPEGRAPLENIITTRPLELVCIDFWSAEDSRNKSVDVLVITDHFTRMAQAFSCKDQTAKQVARVLWDRYFCVFGFPERIHSDQGANFESQLISELLQVSGVRKSHTTPYHPMGNGSVERFNRTLGGMIRALTPGEKADWPRRLQTLTFMYNCAAHETTGYPPFYLMFGRVPRLPVDVLFRTVLHDSDVTSYDKYVACLANDLKEAMVVAQDHAAKEQDRHAQLYNRKVKGSKIVLGDRVLVANRTDRGKRKLADRWDSIVYTVVGVNEETHTYRICDTLSGREKVIHRNLILLANFFPVRDACDMSDLSSSVHATTSSVSGSVDGGEARGSVFGGAGGPICATSEGLDTEYGRHSRVTVGEGQNPLTDPEPADSERRTFEWVTQLSVSSRAEVDTADVAGVISDSMVVSISPGDLSTKQSVPSDFSLVTTVDVPAHVGQTDAAPNTMTQTERTSDTLHTVSRFRPMHSVNADAQTQVRSRFGRLIQPVNRLIQTMSRQDVIQGKFNVGTVSSSVFQVFPD